MNCTDLNYSKNILRFGKTTEHCSVSGECLQIWFLHKILCTAASIYSQCKFLGSYLFQFLLDKVNMQLRFYILHLKIKILTELTFGTKCEV